MRMLTLIAALLATTTALAQESDVGGQVGEMSLTAEEIEASVSNPYRL